MTTNKAGKRTNQKQKHPREPALWNTHVLQRDLGLFTGIYCIDATPNPPTAFRRSPTAGLLESMKAKLVGSMPVGAWIYETSSTVKR